MEIKEKEGQSLAPKLDGKEVPVLDVLGAKDPGPTQASARTAASVESEMWGSLHSQLHKGRAKMPPALRRMLEPEVIESMLRRLDNDTKKKLGLLGGAENSEAKKYEKVCMDHFRRYDKDGTDSLSGEELEQAVQEAVPEHFRNHVGAFGAYMHDLILAFDTNRDGEIQRDEFFRFCKWVLAMTILCYFDMPAYKECCDECHLPLELMPDPYDPTFYYCEKCWDTYAGNFRGVFEQIDVDGNGKVSTRELETALAGCGIDDVQEMVRQMDTDGNGFVAWGEWCSAMSLRLRKALLKLVGADGRLKGFSIFHAYAIDGTGSLTRRELQLLLAAVGMGDNVEKVLTQLDCDRTGSVSLQEWIAKMPPEVEDAIRLKLNMYRPGKGLVDKKGTPTTKQAVDKQLGHHYTAEALISFQVFDEDGDGELSQAELKKALARLGVDAARFNDRHGQAPRKMRFEEWAKHVDPEVSRHLRAMLCGEAAQKQKQQLEKVFQDLDVTECGKVSRKQLLDLAQNGEASEEAVEALRKLDADGDGYVDLNEWLLGMNSAKERLAGP